MHAKYRISPDLMVEFDAASDKDLFMRLAELTEAVGHTACGMCGSANIAFAKRNVDGNDFLEVACLQPECGARLSMGQSKQRPGEIFPIRKVITKGPEKGKPSRKKGDFDKENGGWTKWRGKPLAEDSED